MAFHRNTRIEDILHFNLYCNEHYIWDSDKYSEKDINIINKIVIPEEVLKEDIRLMENYTLKDIEKIFNGNLYDEYVLMIAFKIAEDKLNKWLHNVGQKRDVKKSAYIANNYNNFNYE